MVEIASSGLNKFYQQYPRIPIVVTAQANGRKNAMVVARHTVVSTTPPNFGISISSESFTYQLIVNSKEFGVNFLPYEEAELVDAIGSSKGMEIDKFQRFNLAVVEPLKTAVPILKAAYAAYECQLVDDRVYGDHRLLVGKIVAVHWLQEAFTADETLDLDKANPVLYLGNERYLTTLECSIRTLDREVYGKP